MVEIGETICSFEELTGWSCFCLLPETVAWQWVLEAAPEAKIDGQWTAEETPMKNWQSGRAVVVGLGHRHAVAILRMYNRYSLLFKARD